MIDQNFMHPVIEVRNLTRDFGPKRALNDVTLSVPRGSVFGLVGANGAGKTTLIKHLLGLLKAQSGEVRVFDLNPVEDPVGTLSRIGYLSEENDIPTWMRVSELMRYVRAFYPGWSPQYEKELCESFELSPNARIKNLSKGQRARVGLVVALAYRPELLLLDEPSSGLDPIVRRDILAAIIQTIAEEGRTVLFSSHLLREVEQVSDHVAILSEGQLVMSGPLDEIKESHHRVTLRMENPEMERSGMLDWQISGREGTGIWHGDVHDLREWGEVVEHRSASLDEIFVAHVGSVKAGESNAGSPLPSGERGVRGEGDRR